MSEDRVGDDDDEMEDEVKDYEGRKGTLLCEEEVVEGCEDSDEDQIGNGFKGYQGVEAGVGSQEFAMLGADEDWEVGAERGGEDHEGRHNEADPDQDEPAGKTFKVAIEVEEGAGEGGWVGRCGGCLGAGAVGAGESAFVDFGCALGADHQDSLSWE